MVSPAHPKFDPPLARPDPTRPQSDPKPGPTRARPGQRELAIRSGIISVVAPSIPQSFWGACGSTVLPLRIVGGRAAAVCASPCRQERAPAISRLTLGYKRQSYHLVKHEVLS